MQKSFIKLIVKIALLLVFMSCSEPTEEERLAKFRGSIKYKTYRLTSEKAAKLAVIEHAKTSKEPINEHLIHSSLGIFLFLSGQSEFSLAEADILAENAYDQSKALSLGLKTIALSKLKYPTLSKSCYEELKAFQANQKNTDVKSIEMEHKIFLLSLIFVGFHQNDPDLAKSGADALGTISQLDYLPPLVGVIVETRNGSPLKAIEQLNELNKSDRFSEHKKKFFSEVKDILSKSPNKEKASEDIINLIQNQVVNRVLEDIFKTDGKIAVLQKAKTLPNFILGNKTTSEATTEPNDIATSSIVGTWRSSHDGGGDTMKILNDGLFYTGRNCTDAEKEMKCSWEIKNGWFCITKDGKIEKFKFLQHENATYLVNESYFKSNADKLPEYVFQNAFKKIE